MEFQTFVRHNNVDLATKKIIYGDYYEEETKIEAGIVRANAKERQGQYPLPRF